MDIPNLKNLPVPQLEEFVLSMGEQKFRAKQILKWIYQKRLSDFNEMTNMPKTLRSALAEKSSIAKLDPHVILESSSGDAVKFGFVLPDTDLVSESVLLIDDDRRTACVSSQLGCGLGCTFCETAKLGFIRNLTQGEIIGQLIGINDYLADKGDKPVTNIVFMGMGEALSNFDSFISSLKIIMHEDAFNIGARRITVSTAGVIPSIEKLMREDLTIGLAISLNAWNNDLRSRYMPVNKKYPIEQLIQIAKRYYSQTGRRVTFEYVLIRGVTDTDEAAASLEKYLGGFPCKINLIPVNPVSTNTICASQDNVPASSSVQIANAQRLSSPGTGAVERFSDELHRRNLAATIRRSRGQDIMGACGQLTARLKNAAAALCVIVTLAFTLSFAQDDDGGPAAPKFHLFSRAVPPSPVSQSLAGAGTAMTLDGFGGLVNPALTNAALTGRNTKAAGVAAAGFGRTDSLFNQAVLPFAAVFSDQNGMMGAYYRYMRGDRGSAHGLTVNFAGTLFEQVDEQGAVEFGLNMRYEGSNRRHDTGLDAEGKTQTQVVHGKSVLLDIGFYQPRIYPGLDFALVINNVTGYIWTDIDGANQKEGWADAVHTAMTIGAVYTLPLWSQAALRLPFDVEFANLFTRSAPAKYVIRTGAEARIAKMYCVRFGYANAPENPLDMITGFNHKNLFFGGAGLSVESIQADFFIGRNEFGISASYWY
ncbi:MAG: 23S rRNA (adenine(2503)-C(2))-methyltransferase RlmN [Chitinispirillia bacterium]|nr:23S rRNA (adenine(2503)-C(2))-methyltransferase RlmN [Chitinispirillia bacterium]MCL2241848.1 23S rRNA (adenine(2503)-C(2))-methyltransferase RlmN [Chitinispirillia bacterium]